MNPQRRAERRSLAYHHAIAARLGDEPALLARTRSRVDGWRGTGEVHPHYVEIWSALLAKPLEEILTALVDEGEVMTAARKSSPFAGALAPRERWQLFRSVGP